MLTAWESLNFQSGNCTVHPDSRHKMSNIAWTFQTFESKCHQNHRSVCEWHVTWIDQDQQVSSLGLSADSRLFWKTLGLVSSEKNFQTLSLSLSLSLSLFLHNSTTKLWEVYDSGGLNGLNQCWGTLLDHWLLIILLQMYKKRAYVTMPCRKKCLIRTKPIPPFLWGSLIIW